MMFDNVGNPIDGWAIVKWVSDKQPEIVSLHQCLGNAEEENMVLNEMADGTDTTVVVKNTFGCMIETT